MLYADLGETHEDAIVISQQFAGSLSPILTTAPMGDYRSDPVAMGTQVTSGDFQSCRCTRQQQCCCLRVKRCRGNG